LDRRVNFKLAIKSAGTRNAVVHLEQTRSYATAIITAQGELPRTDAIALQCHKKIFFSYVTAPKNEWIVSFDFHDNRRAGNWTKGVGGGYEKSRIGKRVRRCIDGIDCGVVG
jgi:hypothetical protein